MNNNKPGVKTPGFFVGFSEGVSVPAQPEEVPVKRAGTFVNVTLSGVEGT
jgi:hypothetical protein